jgi:O-antigen/teichoic acid export membrane protein
MASTKRQFAVNVSMNWVATAVNMVIPFFLTPFVVRHLGSAAYGVWILAMSTVSYLALLDLGLRSAIIRFVSKAIAQEKLPDATAAIGAALWFRLLVACGVAVISVGLAFAAPHFFKLPPELVRPAQFTIALAALSVGVTLVSGVFGAVLTALNRFDLLSSITSGQVLVRAGGVLLILRRGHGLISLACWDLMIALLVGLVTLTIALRIFPSSRVRIKRPESQILRTIWSYSFTTFVFMIATQIVINTDNVVIGAFLSVTAVTFYAIGSSLVNYAGQVSGAVSSTFTPLASGLEASGRMQEVQKMLIRGTQGMLGLALPIAVALLFRGETFINLWMGPQYGKISERVLQILMLALYLGLANSTAGSIMMAIEKHKTMTRWAVYEAILNLGLSIIMVKTIGIYGVALGTTIASVVMHVGFWPRHVRDELNVPIRTYLWEGWGRITVAAIPFAIVCALTNRYWHASSLITFFAQVLATLPVYVVTVYLLFRSQLRGLVRKSRSVPLVQA